MDQLSSMASSLLYWFFSSAKLPMVFYLGQDTGGWPEGLTAMAASRDREGQAPCQKVTLHEHCWHRLQTPQLIWDVLLVTWRNAFPTGRKPFNGSSKSRECLLI